MLKHYQKTGENQRNYQRKYSVGSYYRQTKFRLKICRYIPTVSPTDYFFRWFYRRNDRGIQTEIAIQWHGTVTDGITDEMYPSVIPSVKTIIYTPSADTLFLCFSFFFFPIPNCSQLPIPTLHYSQHNHSSFLYLVHGYNIRFLWILSFFCK